MKVNFVILVNQVEMPIFVTAAHTYVQCGCRLLHCNILCTVFLSIKHIFFVATVLSIQIYLYINFKTSFLFCTFEKTPSLKKKAQVISPFHFTAHPPVPRLIFMSPVQITAFSYLSKLNS